MSIPFLLEFILAYFSQSDIIFQISFRRCNAIVRSRKVLIFLVAVFLAIRIANAMINAISLKHSSEEEFVLSGTYECTVGDAGDSLLLFTITWILATVWEVLVLCLAVWIALKHFRELRQHSAGIIEDCFTVLMKTHLSYFASFVAVSCFDIAYLLPGDDARRTLIHV
ncbi:hypothetical protein EDB19DRAFT_827369 [Suillus lakei]|nr:hypothetical protein EDB19DRAFT_827369 [Suillus lakei]